MGRETDDVTALRNRIEFLVVDIMRRTERSFDIQLSDWSDTYLNWRNERVRECWQLLDQLSAWAGGRRYYPAPHDRTHYNVEGKRDCPDCSRSEYVKACLRLLAEVEPGSDIEAIRVDVHNTDGSDVTYISAPRIPGKHSDPPLWRIIHDESHDNCVTITGEEEV